MECPNCKTAVEDGIEICPQCGNPLSEGRPWDKVNKKKSPSAAAATTDKEPDGPKVKHQHWVNSKQQRYNAVMEQEWYLENEFVVKVGYCGYTPDPYEPEEMREGTAILTKKAIIFGNSEHSIRCGKYVVEIPLEIIEYVTDGKYRGKAAFWICTGSGNFLMFPMKAEEWRNSFEFVEKYRPDADDGLSAPAVKPKLSFGQRWGKLIFHLLGAIACFLLGAFERGFFRIVFICVGFGFLLLVGISIFAPEKLKKQ